MKSTRPMKSTRRPALAGSHWLPRAVAGVAAALALAGCATSSASVTAEASKAKVIDERTAIAKQTYDREVGGGVVDGRLHEIAADAALRKAASAGSVSGMRAAVNQKFMPVWFHQHVSRLQILRSDKVVVDAGVPFVVDGPHTSLPGGFTLRISVQDEIGFVRLISRHHPVQVVVRGRGAAHVRSSLPAATHATLPSAGTVTLARVHYFVRSFSRKALGGEPVKIWILQRA
jgi:hypothetical protein